MIPPTIPNLNGLVRHYRAPQFRYTFDFSNFWVNNARSVPLLCPFVPSSPTVNGPRDNIALPLNLGLEQIPLDLAHGRLQSGCLSSCAPK